MRIIRLDEQTKQNILEDLLKRDPNQYSAYAGTVQQIIDEVKAKGDEALFGYTRQFDHAQITPSNVRVTKEEMEEAKNQVDPALIRVMETSMANIREYHQRQIRPYIRHIFFDIIIDLLIRS